MIPSLAKLIFGVLLVTLPFWLTTRFIKRVLDEAFRQPPKRKKLVTTSVIVLHWIVLEVMGLHLVLDPMIPGKGRIYVHTPPYSADHSPAFRNVVTEVAPVRFNGHPNFESLRTGSPDHTGIYSTIVLFDWGESNIFFRVYNRARPEKSLVERYVHVSPYVRVGLFEKHIYVREE